MIVESYGGKRYKTDFVKYLVYSQAECHKTIGTLIFLFETGSLGDKMKYDDWRNKYDLLSNRINKFTQWFEENWNQFPSPETGNL